MTDELEIFYDCRILFQLQAVVLFIYLFFFFLFIYFLFYFYLCIFLITNIAFFSPEEESDQRLHRCPCAYFGPITLVK